MNPRPSSLILEGSSDPDGLVCLQAEPPPRMVEAIADRACGILGDIRTVHRLQREALEGEIGEAFRLGANLRIDQLQFVATPQHEPAARFRANANPIQSFRRL